MRDGSVLEVLATFLKLGVSAFGGPVAHLGYFRRELVLRRGWLDEAAYADLVALCQFLPGPASSQVGFALGVARGGGLLGGLAAWAGFTLPSALLLVLFALFAQRLGGPLESGVIHGLKLVAVAVVAQAVWGMARNLAPDRTRAAIALVALAFTVVLAGTWGQDRGNRRRWRGRPAALPRGCPRRHRTPRLSGVASDGLGLPRRLLRAVGRANFVAAAGPLARA